MSPPAPVRVFHGWRIVAVLAVTETVSWGVLYYAFVVFQVPMGDELGFSPAVLGGAFSLAVLLTGLVSVPVGRWLDARGPRGLMTTGSIVCALLVAAWSQVTSVTGLYLVMAGIGAARAAVLYDPAFAVVIRWFHAKRSTALLAVTVVAGFASTIALPASHALIEALGWRGALLVLAGALAALTVLPHWLVLRAEPADLGMHPDGAEHPPPRHLVEGPPDHGSSVRATAGWALRQPLFRWYAAAFAAQACAVIVVAVHLVPFLLEHGHTAAFAATATGTLGALSVSGRLVLTGAARRIPVGVATAVMFTLQATGVLVLMTAGETVAGAATFVLLFGAGFGVGTIARPVLLAHGFGVARYATLAALMTVLTTVATTTGPFAAGLARTVTGSYSPALVGVLMLCAAATVSLLRATRLAASVTQEAVR
ncbi:MFS transporter [Fodinibacter luteus]|uniref:MFS transporter n=1 Tax=Fodinibacter luteus TaxID=552064 RepID=A0ABP8KS26_9MICO